MILGIIAIFDVIWLITIWSTWTSSDFISTVWFQLRPWRVIIMLLSIVNILLKGATVVVIKMETKNELPYQKMKNDQDKTKNLL